MQPLLERPDQIDQTLLLTHGSATLSTSAHHWASLHPDTPYSDPREEALPEEEAAGDSPAEATLEAVEADSQEGEEDPPTLQEDIKETD